MEVELARLSSELALHVGKKTAETVWDKIRSMKSKGNDKETIAKLEEIISELISEKSEVVQISQSFEEEILMRKISDKDVEYITIKLLPILENLIKQSESDHEEVKEMLKLIEPLLSRETFKILQLLGFNFKEAIGLPLTNLISSLINSQSKLLPNDQADYNILQKQYEIKMLDVISNPDAYERYKELIS